MGRGNFGGGPPPLETIGDLAAVYAMPFGADSCGTKEPVEVGCESIRRREG